MVCFWNEERPHCFVVCLNKPFPDQPACIKPQTSISMKRIQRLFQIAVKTKESAAFSDNLAAFRIHRCARRCTSALFTGAGISTLKSICRHALSSHHAAVIVSSIYSNYSFHHFWFTKKKKKREKKAVNTSFECFTQFFFFPFGKKTLQKTQMSHCGCDVELQNFQRFNSNVLSKGFLMLSWGFLLIFRWEDADVYSCSQFTDDHNPTDWKQGSNCF